MRTKITQECVIAKEFSKRLLTNVYVYFKYLNFLINNYEMNWIQRFESEEHFKMSLSCDPNDGQAIKSIFFFFDENK